MNFSKFVLAASMAQVAGQAPKHSRNLKEEKDSAVSLRGLRREECKITFVNAELKEGHVPTDPDGWFSKPNHIDPKPYATFEFVSKGPDGFVHEAEEVAKGKTEDGAGLTPEWFETKTISYEVSNKGYNLYLELWDDDSHNHDDYIGKGSVAINNHQYKNREDITVELKNEKEQGAGVIVGTITIYLDQCSFLDSDDSGGSGPSPTQTLDPTGDFDIRIEIEANEEHCIFYKRSYFFKGYDIDVFGFDNNTWQSIRITALPQSGVLKNWDKEVRLNEEIRAGWRLNMVFQPDRDDYGEDYATMQFKVTGVFNYVTGLYDSESLDYTIHFTVSAPVITHPGTPPKDDELEGSTKNMHFSSSL